MAKNVHVDCNKGKWYANLIIPVNYTTMDTKHEEILPLPLNRVCRSCEYLVCWSVGQVWVARNGKHPNIL